MADDDTRIQRRPGTGGPGDEKPPPDNDTDPDSPPGSGGTTTAGGGSRRDNAGLDVTVAGNPALTSATTTANTPADNAADQADRELAGFFSTGTGPAQHYHVVSQGEAEPVEAETISVGRQPARRPGRAGRRQAKKATAK